MHWKKLAPEEFHEKKKKKKKKKFASLSQGCFMSSQNDSNEVITESLQELITDHEDTGTFPLFHAKHASTAFPFIIKTPDTDIFLLCLAQQHKLSTNLYVVTNMPSYLFDQLQRNVDLHLKVRCSLDAFTGCDSVVVNNNRKKNETKKQKQTTTHNLLHIIKVSLKHPYFYISQCVHDKVTSKSKWQYKSKERNLITSIWKQFFLV